MQIGQTEGKQMLDMMGARHNANFSKESDANGDTCCVLINVDKDGISSEEHDISPLSSKTSADRLPIGTCPPKVKSEELNKQSVCLCTPSQDSGETNDLHLGSGESRSALSTDKIIMNIKPLDETENAESPPRFITVFGRVLPNSPSFVVQEDDSTQNQSKQNLDYSDLSPTESCHDQQQTLPQVNSSHAECHTDEMCSHVDEASSNNSCRKGNDVSTTQNLSQPPDVPSQVPHIENPPGAKQTQSKLQDQQPQSTSSHAPYVTINFVPLSQPGSGCGTSVAPCQQFLRAATSNASSCSFCTSNCCLSRSPHLCQMPSCCSFCTSNCCLPRPPQVCKMPNTTCCYPGLVAQQNLGCCLLTPYGYPYCCCSRSSLGFPGHCNTGGMPVSNQISHQSGFAPGSIFHSGINPYLCHLKPTCSQCSHCRMHVHHYPHCKFAGFVNNQQEYPLQMGQLPKPGHKTQCDCCLRQQPKKVKGWKVSEDEGLNRDNLKAPKKYPRVSTQSFSEDQVHQEQTSKSKSSSEAPRALGGAVHIRSCLNSTAFYAARCGRTFLILRPTGSAMVPRLRTRHISRYTSVIMVPKKIIP